MIGQQLTDSCNWDQLSCFRISADRQELASFYTLEQKFETNVMCTNNFVKNIVVKWFVWMWASVTVPHHWKLVHEYVGHLCPKKKWFIILYYRDHAAAESHTKNLETLF